MGVKTEVGESQRALLLGFLRDYQREHKFLPSIAEMGRATGMRRTVVQWHLEKLREQKKVTYVDGNMARSLRLKGRA